MIEIADPDVRILAVHSETLRNDVKSTKSDWDGSPFEWIRTLPSATRGAIGVKLLAGWLATKGFDITRSPDSDADRLVNGQRAEVKFSTLWKGGVYKFQQLRDQDYKFAICLGLSPFNAHCWVLRKELIFGQKNKAAGLKGQHGGGDGKDTAWLTVSPSKVPDWLRPHGGSLADAARLIVQVTGQEPLP